MTDKTEQRSCDKLKAYRDSLSQEQKDALLKQAQAARIANIAERDANAHLLKTDYLDEPLWHSLASKYKIRLPHMNEKASAKSIRKYLKKADVSTDKWNESYTSVAYFLENNPKWTALACAGIIMEMR